MGQPATIVGDIYKEMRKNVSNFQLVDLRSKEET